MKAIAAIDGGGTKTDCLLASLQGEWLGHGQGGPSVPYYVPLASALEAVRTALGEALGMVSVPPEMVGVAAALPMGAEVVREVAGEGGCAPEAIWPVDEAAACLAAAGEARGLVIMAGTGSFAAAVEAGRHLGYAGGKGPLLGDEGSAYAIAAAALRAVARALDGRAPATRLGDLLYSHLGVQGVWGLVGKVYNPPLARHEIAGLAPLVSQAAEEGDETAHSILCRAGEELAEMAQTALRKAAWLDDSVPVVLAGGALLGSRPLQEALRGALSTQAPAARSTVLRLRPVVGVALEGIARATGERSPAVRQRLRETTPADWQA